MTVELYAPDGQVELLLNGIPVAAAETSECYALFEVPCEAGVLTAVGPDASGMTCVRLAERCMWCATTSRAVTGLSRAYT